MKRLPIPFLFIPVFAAAFLPTGCLEKKAAKTKAEVIQEKLVERRMIWETDVRRKCRESVLNKAVAIADSMIIAQARQRRDTSGRPVVPPRPAAPDPVSSDLDTLPLQPILQKER
ncbi:MAG: hypothetical protein RLY31_1589 [Bacteroidota bacterium]|jgi:hypothetical protein